MVNTLKTLMMKSLYSYNMEFLLHRGEFLIKRHKNVIKNKYE